MKEYLKKQIFQGKILRKKQNTKIPIFPGLFICFAIDLFILL